MSVFERVLREFNRYTGDGLPDEPVGAPLPIGDPGSGAYEPSKSELRDAFASISAGSGISQGTADAIYFRLDSITGLVDQSGDATPASVKAALGYGTAADKDTGTAIGNVPLLEDVDGNAGLPAVDGSQLTGIINEKYLFIKDASSYSVAPLIHLVPFDISMTTTGGNVLIDISLNAEADFNTVYRVFRDGVEVGRPDTTNTGSRNVGITTHLNDNDTASTMSTMRLFFVDEGVPAGTHTWSLHADTSQYGIVVNRTWSDTNTKNYERVTSMVYLREMK